MRNAFEGGSLEKHASSDERVGHKEIISDEARQLKQAVSELESRGVLSQIVERGKSMAAVFSLLTLLSLGGEKAIAGEKGTLSDAAHPDNERDINNVLKEIHAHDTTAASLLARRTLLMEQYYTLEENLEHTPLDKWETRGQIMRDMDTTWAEIKDLCERLKRVDREE